MEEERRAQEDVLKVNALRLHELEELLNQNQQTPDVQEVVDTRMKLNLLNVINNDRISNQIIESQESVSEDFEDSGSKNPISKYANKISREGTTIATLDTDVVDSYQKPNVKATNASKYLNSSNLHTDRKRHEVKPSK